MVIEQSRGQPFSMIIISVKSVILIMVLLTSYLNKLLIKSFKLKQPENIVQKSQHKLALVFISALYFSASLLHV
ncbi:hypothetical protein C1E24_20270 [Pseudoalteromonas phenolica]|uniref:Uncharacterized protein n=1 Tax=Pseudoalteromonas phenolica TaxID=161398 RepID=A0A5R9PYX5_9GAMM|nr:hypothetical protein C1E24_20270 [Pseudoalteromonas phenolica]